MSDLLYFNVSHNIISGALIKSTSKLQLHRDAVYLLACAISPHRL